MKIPEPSKRNVCADNREREDRAREIANMGVWRRAAVAYMALLGLAGVILIFSLARCAGWKPVLVGLPVLCTIFVSITYQLIKELRMTKRHTEFAQDSTEISEASTQISGNSDNDNN